MREEKSGRTRLDPVMYMNGKSVPLLFTPRETVTKTPNSVQKLTDLKSIYHEPVRALQVNRRPHTGFVKKKESKTHGSTRSISNGSTSGRNGSDSGSGNVEIKTINESQYSLSVADTSAVVGNNSIDGVKTGLHNDETVIADVNMSMHDNSASDSLTGTNPHQQQRQANLELDDISQVTEAFFPHLYSQGTLIQHQNQNHQDHHQRPATSAGIITASRSNDFPSSAISRSQQLGNNNRHKYDHNFDHDGRLGFKDSGGRPSTSSGTTGTTGIANETHAYYSQMGRDASITTSTGTRGSPVHEQLWVNHTQHSREFPYPTDHTTYAIVALFDRDIPTNSHRPITPNPHNPIHFLNNTNISSSSCDSCGSCAYGGSGGGSGSNGGPPPSTRAVRLSASLDRSQTLPPVGDDQLILTAAGGCCTGSLAGAEEEVDNSSAGEIEPSNMNTSMSMTPGHVRARATISCLTRPSTTTKPFQCRRGCKKWFSMVPELLHHEIGCKCKLTVQSAKDYKFYKRIRIPPMFQTINLPNNNKNNNNRCGYHSGIMATNNGGDDCKV